MWSLIRRLPKVLRNLGHEILEGPTRKITSFSIKEVFPVERLKVELLYFLQISTSENG